MSSLGRWSYVEGPCTVWPPGGFDDFNQPIGGTPYLIPTIDYQFGGKLARDDNGTEFVPSITVYFEAANDSPLIPEREWYIKLGDHTLLAQPPNDAERIKVVRADPMTKFGAGELPDWRIMT